MRVNQYIAEIQKQGIRVIRQSGSHKIVSTNVPGRPAYVIGLHDRDDIGHPMRARLNKALGVNV